MTDWKYYGFTNWGDKTLDMWRCEKCGHVIVGSDKPPRIQCHRCKELEDEVDKEE